MISSPRLSYATSSSSSSGPDALSGGSVAMADGSVIVVR